MAAMMHQHVGADPPAKLQHRAHGGLLVGEMRLVHEVRDDEAVHRVADVELGADVDQPLRPALDDPPAGDQVLAEQSEFRDVGAEIDDLLQRGLDMIEIALMRRGRKADMGNGVWHGSGLLELQLERVDTVAVVARSRRRPDSTE